MKDLTKMVGQLIITDVSSADIGDAKVLKEYEKLIVDYNVAGIMLFNEFSLEDFPIKIENQLVTEEQTACLIKKLKSYDDKLFIAVDVEGGRVDRLKHVRNFAYDSAKEIGKLVKKKKWNKMLAYAHFYNQGSYLKELGFNMNAAPVLDVVPSYRNKYLMAYSERSFSSDADLVSKIGGWCIQSLQNVKVMPVAKHFPGIGSVLKKYDPHFDYPHVRKITEKSMKPFKDAIKSGVDVIMTTHVIVDEHGKDIATVNENIIGLLRNNAFEGVVITDCITMMSTGMLNRKRKTGPTEENLKNIVDTGFKALKAGHDMVLLRQLGCVNNPETDFIKSLIDKVADGVEKGDISYEQILRSYEKVLNLKKRYC